MQYVDLFRPQCMVDCGIEMITTSHKSAVVFFLTEGYSLVASDGSYKGL